MENGMFVFFLGGKNHRKTIGKLEKPEEKDATWWKQATKNGTYGCCFDGKKPWKTVGTG